MSSDGKLSEDPIYADGRAKAKSAMDRENDRLRALYDFDILDTEDDPVFNNLVQIAAEFCEAPAALVSLVDRDRQWFKARTGFGEPQTGLQSSVCFHAIQQADVLEIPNLTDDARTAANPLVTGAPHLRFYAGAPLATSDGHRLGALCVLDSKPRATGLSDAQRSVLTALAGQVVAQMELRRALKQRDAEAAALARSEKKWRSLFETLREGFIVGELVRDRQGRVIDWRYDEVNNAWHDLVGIKRGDAVGRTIREVFPGIEDEWVNEFAMVAETGKAIRFTRQVGSLDRWYDGVAQPAGGDLFTVIFVEVTDRILRERRQAAMVRLTDKLIEENTIEGMALAASAVLGEALDVELVGYGDVDSDAETITVSKDWTNRGAETLAGTLNFRNFGSYIEDLKRGETVVVLDSRVDPRTKEHTEALEVRSARAFVNTPVFERGIFVALLYVSTCEPREWSEQDLEFIRTVAYRLRSAVERLRAEQQQEILNGELSHRLKNTLSVVQAIASQTLGRSDPKAASEFTDRLKALAAAHDILLRKSWSTAGMREIVENALSTFDSQQRVVIEGENLEIGPRATLSLSLLLHELATNAVKYGALSASAGRVAISWRIQGEGDSRSLTMSWVERGGPPVIAPSRRGFGSRIVRMGLTGSGQTDVQFSEEGLTVEMSASLLQLQQV